MLSQALVNGIATGLVTALPALALTLVFGVMRFANFAIGATLTFGTYAAYYFNVGLGLPLFVSAVISAAITAALCVLVNRLVYQNLPGASGITLLVASMGVAFLVENFVRFIYGNSVRGYQIQAVRPWRLLDLRISQEQIVNIAVALGCLALIWLLLYRTSMGRAMRAVADNPSLAAVRGIRPARVISGTFALSGALTGLAGVLIGVDGAVEPLSGYNYIIPVFAAAILGGIGDPVGAVVGALVLGVVEEVSSLVLPSTYRSGIAFVVMAVVLMVRPWGLFGTEPIKK